MKSLLSFDSKSEMFNFCARQITENLPGSQFISLFQTELSLSAETIKLKKIRFAEAKQQNSFIC